MYTAASCGELRQLQWTAPNGLTDDLSCVGAENGVGDAAVVGAVVPVIDHSVANRLPHRVGRR